MAITTLDLALAGMKPASHFSKAVSGTLVAGRPFTPLYTAGYPGPATAYAGGLNGTVLTSLAGQIPIPAASGNTHLARFSAIMSAQGGLLMLCDRLWHNSIVVTTTGAQNITCPTWPARDRNGATAGEGVVIGLEISGTVGTGTATPAIVYTNQAGTGSKAGAMLIPYVASSLIGTFYPFTLAAGDSGVRSVQSVTLSVSMTSGTAGLVAYRVLATLELATLGIPNAIDALTGGLPRCYDTTVPFLIYVPTTTTTTQMHGTCVFTQG